MKRGRVVVAGPDGASPGPQQRSPRCPGQSYAGRKIVDCGSEDLEVWTYRANYSAFNGYRRTQSEYSEVRCRKCGKIWRTKAAYVDSLPLAKDAR